MTQRLTSTFARLREDQKPAFVGFLTAGDPHPKHTPDLMHAYARNGVDILELGIPFSDPIADGPTIQRASARALGAGMDLSKVLDCVRSFRDTDTTTPIILFGYLNPLLAFGLERIASEAAQAGADGFLIVDLPAEESDVFTRYLQPHDLDLIFLVSPNTTEARIQNIVTKATGFIYYVSMAGVTGSSLHDFRSVDEGVARIRKHTALPVCVGFGISTPADVQSVTQSADGFVVGSAILRSLETSEPDDLLDNVGGFVQSLSEAR